MNIKRTLAFILLYLGISPFIHAGDPLPVTPSEKRFVEFLRKTAEITFQETILNEPWIQCDDSHQERTFFSASLYQFTNTKDVSSNIQSWMSSLLDYAYWGSVQSAHCTYDINQFNECFANGSFSVHFRQKRIINFRKEKSDQFCVI